jgi:23S rRNA (guanosine2251-2'-O)-methyltransferase
VREVLAAGTRRVRDVWVSDTAGDSPLIAEIVSLAASARVPLRRMPRARLDAEARTGSPQGVLAHAHALQPAGLEDLCRPADAGQPPPFLLVVDGVTDPQNLGALLRTAEAAGATGAVLARHRAAHVTPAVTKAAAGAIEHLPIAVVAGLAGALTVLRDRGVWTVGLDPAAPTLVYGLDLAAEAVAVVVGAEGAGLSRLVRARCDLLVAIPQHGAIQSLNVAAAGAIALFEVARARRA